MQYLTDPEAVAEILPEPFKPTEKPVVTVLHQYIEDSDVVERGEYALSAVFVSARFDGKDHQGEGLYALIMPENNNYCVLMGRDSSGTGKIFSDIPKPYQTANGHTICETRVWGYEKGHAQWQTLYGVDFGQMKKCDSAALKKWQDAINALPIYTLKVIPGASGGLDVNYPVKYGFLKEFKECWEGKSAEFYLGNNIDKSLILENRCINAIKTLPVREVLATAHWFDTVGGLPSGVLK